MAIANKNDLSHIVRTTQQWTASYDSYECIPEGVLCVEFTPDGNVKAKIGNGHDIFSKLPYIGGADLTNYYTKSETAKCVEEIIKANRFIRIKGILQNKDQLPSHADCGDLYFVISQNQSSSNKYDEYVYSPSNTWENLGSIPIDIDLSEYAKIVYVDEKIDEVNERIDDIEQHGTHTHANKDILDLITAAFTAEEKDKLSTLYNYDDTELRELITQASHTHSNKDILDAITSPFTKEDRVKLDSLTPYNDSILKEKITALERLAHEHSNKKILDQTTASFTTEYERKMRWIRLYTGCTGMEEGIAGLVPAAQAGEEDYVLSGSGEWVPQTGGGGTYELPIASATVLGGIKVGDGLEINENGKLSVVGGGGGDTITQGGGINVTTDPQTHEKIVSVNAGTGLAIDQQTGELYVTGGGGGDSIAEGGGISINTDPQTGVKTISVNTGDHLEVDENTGELNVTDVNYEAGQGIHIGSDYTLIEYIKNSGNYDQIILTDIIPNFSDKIEIDMKIGAAVANTVWDKPIFGCSGSTPSSYRYSTNLYLASNDSNISCYNHFTYESGNTGSNFFIRPSGVSYDGTNAQRQTLTMSGSTATLGNVSKNFSNEVNNSFIDPQIGIAIFGNISDVGTKNYFNQCNLTVYGVKLYDSNNTLLHDLRPAERGIDGEAGLYDLVTHKFYGNTGNGSFVKGPPVSSVDDRLISAKIGNGLQFDSNDAIEVNVGNGLSVNQDNELEVNTGNGLSINQNNELDVGISNGLQFDSNNEIEINTGNGLSINQDNELEVNIGTGLEIDPQTGAINVTETGGDTVEAGDGIDIDTDAQTGNKVISVVTGNGLEINNDNEVELSPATQNSIGGIKVGDNLNISDDGTLSAEAETIYHPGDAISFTNDAIHELIVEHEEYYFDTQVTCNLHGDFNRIFQKTTSDPALGVIWKVYDNNKLWAGPLFVGLTPDSVKYTTNGATYNAKGSFEYLNATWYYGDTAYYVSNIQNQDFDGNMQVFTDPYSAVADEIQAAKDLIDAAGIIADGYTINVKYGDGLTLNQNNELEVDIGNGLTVNQDDELEVSLGNGLQFDANGAIEVTGSGGGDSVVAGDGIDIDTDQQTGEKIISVVTGEGLLIDENDNIAIDPDILPPTYLPGTAIVFEDTSKIDITIDSWDNGTVWGNWEYTTQTGTVVVQYNPNLMRDVSDSRNLIQVPDGVTQVKCDAVASDGTTHLSTGIYFYDENGVHFNGSTRSTDPDEIIILPQGTVYINQSIRAVNGSSNIAKSDVRAATITWLDAEISPETVVDVWQSGTGWGNGAYTGDTGNGYIAGWGAEVHSPIGNDSWEIPEGAIKVKVHAVATNDALLFPTINWLDSNHNRYGYAAPTTEFDEYVDISPTAKYTNVGLRWSRGSNVSITTSSVASVTLTWYCELPVTGNTIHVNYGNGLTVNQVNELEVNLGSGLAFDANGAIEVTGGGGGGDTIAEGDGISITDDIQTGDKIISVNYGTGLTIDTETGALIIDGQLPEGTILKKLTYMGNGSTSANNIQFSKKPLAIMSIYGSSGSNYIASNPAPIDAPYLIGDYGGVNTNNTCNCAMSYNDTTNVLTLSPGYGSSGDAGLLYNVNGRTYTVWYLIKGHTGDGTSETNEVSVVKTFSYVGTGTATNNIQFPETPNMVLSIYGPLGTSGAEIRTLAIDTTYPSTNSEYFYEYWQNGSGYMRAGTYSFNDTTNILSLVGPDYGASLNYSGLTYTVRYIVNETISSGGGGSGSYEPGTAIEFSNQQRKINPVMTSDVLPYGEVIESGYFSTRYGWNAFDGTDSQTWSSHTWSDGTNQLDDDPESCYVGYVFPEDVYLTEFVLSTYSDRTYTGIIQVRSEGTWTTVVPNVSVVNTRYIKNTYTLQTPVLCDAFRFCVLSGAEQYFVNASPPYGGNVCDFQAIGYPTGASAISVKYGDGLTVNQDNELEVNLGSGLQFDANGAIEVTGGGGGSGDTVAEGDGISINTDQRTGDKVIGVNAGTGLQVNQTTNELEVSSGVVTSISPTQNTPGSITVTEGDGTETPVSVISQMGGATSSTAGTAGYVPAPASGDDDAYLRGDGTWDDSVLTDDDELTLVFVPDDYQPS